MDQYQRSQAHSTGIAENSGSKLRSAIVKIEPNGASFETSGRELWMIERLIEAGGRGVTAIEYPGARLAHYVFLARRDGLIIETIHESHGGPFPGSHARYRLASEVSIIDQKAAA